jgi:DNA-binding response OmpR family regulator
MTPLALIVEDDEKISELLVLALEDVKCEVEVYFDGRTALKRLAVAEPALVVLDIHIPFVSGTELLQTIRTSERLKGTKVILISADLFILNEIGGQADAAFLKPFSALKIREVVAELIASATG